MGSTRYWAFAISAILLAGCTPGAPAAPTAGSQAPTAVVVGVSLITYTTTPSPFGPVEGFNPGIVVVAHGTVIQFHNQDGFNHTATSIAGATFPSGSPIATSALTPTGTDVSQPNWSSGALAAGAYSRTFTTSAVGQYLFGCFYHYSDGMRGVVVVQ